MIKIKYIYFILFFSLMLTCYACADTLTLKNGGKVKGLIVDEYVDRVIISTEEGEKTFIKSKVKSIAYHDKKNHFIQKARNDFRSERYVDAFYNYQQVLELDPNNKEAKEKTEYIEKYLVTKPSRDMRQEVDYKRIKMQAYENIPYVDRVRKEFGVTLAKGEKYVYVKKVNRKAKNFLKTNDRIVSVWAEEVAYATPEQVAKLFLVPGGVKLIVEREAEIKFATPSSLLFFLGPKYKRIIGASLEYTEEGLSVADVKKKGPFYKAGIADGDVIEQIQAEKMVYMPFQEVVRLIGKNQGKKVKVVILKELVIWAKARVQ